MMLFFRHRGGGVLRLFALALGLVVLPVQPSWAEPQDGQVFQDWTVRCEADPADAAVKHCYAIQEVLSPGRPNPIMLVAVAFFPGQDKPVVTVVLPLGTDLRPGIDLAVEDGEATRYPFSVCRPDGCQVHIPLDDALLAALKKGVTGSVVYRRNPDRPADTVPFSLKGFTASVNALR